MADRFLDLDCTVRYRRARVYVGAFAAADSATSGRYHDINCASGVFNGAGFGTSFAVGSYGLSRLEISLFHKEQVPI